MQYLTLRPFQRRFLASALAPGIDTAALCLPRANGKTTLAAHILARCLTPDDPLHIPGADYVLLAGSLEQARLCFRIVRRELEPRGGYSFVDASQRIGVKHPASGTALRVISSNARKAFGIVGCPLLIGDEPGAWDVIGGELMHDAIQTAQGKPDSPLRVLYVGTLAPAAGGWWHELVNRGSRGSVHVTALQGDPDRWDQWPVIRAANPLTAISGAFRRKLLDERNEARADERLKARFLSFRLNVPSRDSAEMLLTAAEWKRVEGRKLGEREGRPVVGIDLGAGRAWSAAVALWPSGRIEAHALAAGTPSIEKQEKRDRVPRGTYERLTAAGVLTTDGARLVPRVSVLMRRVLRWRPLTVTCDRFRFAELLDASRGRVPILPRTARWSSSTADIRAVRRMALDGPLSVAPGARELLRASLSVSYIENDDGGSCRLVKKFQGNRARDDVAQSLTLAAGALTRRPAPARVRVHVA